MTGRIDGAPWQAEGGITIDAPEQALVSPPATLFAWSEKIGRALVITDIWVSRRLRCCLLVDADQREIKATHTVLEAFELALLRGYPRVYIVERVSETECLGREVKPTSRHTR